jgi:hypothetical protein
MSIEKKAVYYARDDYESIDNQWSCLNKTLSVYEVVACNSCCPVPVGTTSCMEYKKLERLYQPTRNIIIANAVDLSLIVLVPILKCSYELGKE